MRQHSPTYEFIDETSRNDVTVTDVADFDIDPNLGREQQAVLLVKWTNQRYHDDNLRAMSTPEWDSVSGISKTNAWRHRNQYYPGLVTVSSLDADYLDTVNAEAAEYALQPTGISTNRLGTVALACGDRILLSDSYMPSGKYHEIVRHDFARLHSVEFDSVKDRLLTTSSSLDLIQEVDLAGNLTWTMDMWDTPFNRNKLGQEFFRSAGRAGLRSYLRNPDPKLLKDDESYRGAVCVLDNPEAYENLGLPTNLTPVFPNTASYGNNNDVLVTTFHRGEAWVIDRDTNEISIVQRGMKHPHGLHTDPLLDGYMVTDTGNEAVHFIASDFRRQITMKLSNLGNRKQGLENSRWLQYTTRLSDDLYCAVVAPRQCLTLFNPVQKTRRDIAFDADWGIQEVVSKNS